MTYAQLRTAAATDAWKNRVEPALIEACINITVDAPATALDIRRDTLARSVLREPSLWLNRFALAVALGFLPSADLGAAVTDAAIATRTAAVFNDFLDPAPTP